MAEQQLNGAHVGAGFQQMDREGVAERMGSNQLGNRDRRWACWQALLTEWVVIGRPGRAPGKSQGRDRFTRHQSRKISSSFGDSMT
jgi:hypothetical protein